MDFVRVISGCRLLTLACVSRAESKLGYCNHICCVSFTKVSNYIYKDENKKQSFLKKPFDYNNFYESQLLFHHF